MAHISDVFLAHEDIVELELNPVIAHTGGCDILDARVIVTADSSHCVQNEAKRTKECGGNAAPQRQIAPTAAAPPIRSGSATPRPLRSSDRLH